MFVVPLKLIGVSDPAVLAAAAAVLWVAGAAPDLIGEAEKWSIQLVPPKFVRDPDKWELYTSAHSGKIAAWFRKWWVLPALLHIWTDKLIHPPTSLVDRDKQPGLYKVVWTALDLASIAIYGSVIYVGLWVV